jgi:hypothetical protein
MNNWNLIGLGILVCSIIVLALIQISLVKGVVMNPVEYFTTPVIVLSIIALFGLLLFL